MGKLLVLVMAFLAVSMGLVRAGDGSVSRASKFSVVETIDRYEAAVKAIDGFQIVAHWTFRPLRRSRADRFDQRGFFYLLGVASPLSPSDASAHDCT